MKKKYIKKPWGSEELISYNKNYVLKKLFMKKGHRCSLQYHKKKHETIYVLSGTLKILIGKKKDNLKKKILKKNQSIIIKPFTIHRMEGVANSIYLEASTSQLSDVVRLSDDYGRKK
jgi:mannose-6-phosphate isomerase-like protein (cupin superfamily)